MSTTRWMTPLLVAGRAARPHPGRVAPFLTAAARLPPVAAGLRRVAPRTHTRLMRAAAAADALAYQRSAIVLAAVRTGILPVLADAAFTAGGDHDAVDLTAAQVAKVARVDPAGAARILDALADLRYVTRHDYGRYRVTDLGWAAATDDIVYEVQALAAQTWASWGRLHSAVVTGDADQDMDVVNGRAGAVHAYLTLANELIVPALPDLVARLPLRPGGRLLVGEVGLSLARHAVSVEPGLSVAVAALDAHRWHLSRLLGRYPLPQAPEVIVAADGDPGHTRWATDEGGDEAYDVVVLYRKMAYHRHGFAFLEKAARVIRPGGAVVVIEPTSDSDAPTRSFLSELAVMDYLVGGRDAPGLWSSADLVAMVDAAGFTPQVIAAEGLRIVIGWQS